MARFHVWLRLAVFVSVMAGAAHAGAATTKIINQDAGDEGLNDPTPVAPVGGNPGTRLGQQRLIAIRYAARILGNRLGSSVPIRIAVNFTRLGCSQNGGTLGQASATNLAAGFGPLSNDKYRTDTYYPEALANALAGKRVADVTNDISAKFNSRLDEGAQDCLRGTTWYYGLDGKQPDGTRNFVSTAVHELIHGFGFESTVALTDRAGRRKGQFPGSASGSRFPDIFSRFVMDLSMPAGQQRWDRMSTAQRADSITNGESVVWGDVNTGSQAATVLVNGIHRGYVELYAPDPVELGSSISHWSKALSPDQLMEPFAHRIDPANGIGVSACVLENIGWTLINNTQCPDVDSAQITEITSTSSPTPSNTSSETSPSTSDTSDNTKSGGGGGCTIDRNARFDPIWFVLLALATWVLIRRRPRMV